MMGMMPLNLIIKSSKDFTVTGGVDEPIIEVSYIRLREIWAYKTTISGNEEGSYGG